MSWKAGPLPPKTYFWGGIMKVGSSGYGFHIADFHGDHATIIPGGERVEADQIAAYNNALDLPLPRQLHMELQNKGLLKRFGAEEGAGAEDGPCRME